MTTATEIITDALEEIGYKAAETPVEAADLKLGLRKLNDMFAAWEGSNLDLGAAPVEDAADTVRIPRWAVEGVKMSLAGRLLAPFKRPLTNELTASIKAATTNMLRAMVKPIDVVYPDSLPLGSGNECNGENYDRKFFSNNQDENF